MAPALSQSVLCFYMADYSAKKYNASMFHENQTSGVPRVTPSTPQCLSKMIKPTASKSLVICVVPVDDTASCSQVLRSQQPPIQGVVLHEGGLAVRRGVYVPVVANREQRLKGVLHHAGHCHRDQAVCLVIFKDIAPLAM